MTVSFLPIKNGVLKKEAPKRAVNVYHSSDKQVSHFHGFPKSKAALPKVLIPQDCLMLLNVAAPRPQPHLLVHANGHNSTLSESTRSVYRKLISFQPQHLWVCLKAELCVSQCTNHLAGVLKLLPVYREEFNQDRKEEKANHCVNH
ncbi:hypothetical protein Y1Q_0010850 [Alligator mississippiensis]|uniref:Uncharacterized protein n=1 Tax=Alligator mississippiensis TaxID=8496 RepID=A0A151M706_ALLMI|nr:hypothetical protein Y1Q_0010850 [Alligator mississippiensis]